VLDFFAEHETEIKLYIEKNKNPVLPSVPETVLPSVPESLLPSVPATPLPNSPKSRVERQDSQPDITPEAIQLVAKCFSHFFKK
jgi:hypothetical protein